MTREEAIGYKWFMLDLRDKLMDKSYTAHINKIYDDFESRTCENCIKFKADVSKYGEYEGTCLAGIIQHQDLGTVKIDFGCNEFERKEDERD